MTRRARRAAVIGILVASLTVTAFGAIRAQTSGPPPIEADAAVVLAPLDDVGPALTRLLESARRHAAGGDAASREPFGHALARFAEVRTLVERIPAGAKPREDGQLLEALHALVPRIHVLALEIADGATPEKLALLERLADKTRAALDQLSEAGQLRARAAAETIAGPAPRAPGSVVPEGVAVLLLTVACAVSMALVSARPADHPVRRVLARESRRWRCLQ
ncbi:MAG: hypothetical protein HYU25_08985 [Candidatus Rokubacteria bacterium]|nr:hypothetical protein [Candidatus Rokubacteria bacterium]